MAWLAVYGHVNVDYILHVDHLPGADVTVPVQSESIRLGGTGANTALAAASLGVPTALAARVGDDFPTQYRAQLSGAGIDLQGLKHEPGPTPKIWILATPQGAQSSIIDQGVMGDAFAKGASPLPMLEATWVHFTTGSPHEWLPLARDGHAARKHVGFDPAQELSYRYTGRLFEDLMNETEVFFGNERELEHAMRLLEYGDPAQLLDHAQRVIITRGAQGLRYVSDKERLDVPACPVRNAGRIDPVGAGDVLRGGIYAGLHRNQPWSEALRTGAVAASLFLEARNERFPDWAQVVARRDGWKP